MAKSRGDSWNKSLIPMNPKSTKATIPSAPNDSDCLISVAFITASL